MITIFTNIFIASYSLLSCACNQVLFWLNYKGFLFDQWKQFGDMVENESFWPNLGKCQMGLGPRKSEKIIYKWVILTLCQQGNILSSSLSATYFIGWKLDPISLSTHGKTPRSDHSFKTQIVHLFLYKSWVLQVRPNLYALVT